MTEGLHSTRDANEDVPEPRERHGRDSKWFAATVFCLALFTAAVGGLGWFHLRERRQYLIEHHARHSASIGREIASRYKSLQSILRLVGKEAQQAANGGNIFRSILAHASDCGTNSESNKEPCYRSRLAAVVTARSSLHSSLTIRLDKGKCDLSQVAYILQENGQYQLQLGAVEIRPPNKRSLSHYCISGRTQLPNLTNHASSHERSDKFDDILMLLPDGRVAFQRDEHTSLPWGRLDAASAKEVFQPEHLSEQKLAGKRYELFIHPLPIPARSPPKQSHERNSTQENKDNAHRPTELIHLVGVLSSDRLESATRQVPVESSIVAVVLLFIALLAWPVLKLLFMGRHHRLRRADLVFLIFSMISVSALVSVLLVARGAREKIESDAAEAMKGAARDLARELDKVLRMSETEVHALDYGPTGSDKSLRSKELSDTNEYVRGTAQKYDAKWSPVSRDRSGFKFGVFVDTSGEQFVKRYYNSGDSRNTHITPWVSVGDRPYFRRAMEFTKPQGDQPLDAELWKRSPQEWEEALDTKWRAAPNLWKANPAAIEIVRSKTDDRLSLVAAKARPNPLPDARGLSVAITTFELHLEQMASRVPGHAGLEFFLVEPNGRVLGSSEGSDTLEVNIFDELSSSADLRPRLAKGIASSQPERVRFRGRTSRVIAHPVANPDDGGFRWSLVVVGDRLGSETVYADILVSSFMRYLCWLTLVLVGLFLVRSLFRRIRHPEVHSRQLPLRHLWPHPAGANAAIGVSLCGILCPAITIALWIALDASPMIIWAVCTISTGVISFIILPSPHGSRRRFGASYSRASYTIMYTTIILNLSFFPAYLATTQESKSSLEIAKRMALHATLEDPGPGDLSDTEETGPLQGDPNLATTRSTNEERRRRLLSEFFEFVLSFSPTHSELFPFRQDHGSGWLVRWGKSGSLTEFQLCEEKGRRRCTKKHSELSTMDGLRLPLHNLPERNAEVGEFPHGLLAWIVLSLLLLYFSAKILLSICEKLFGFSVYYRPIRAVLSKEPPEEPFVDRRMVLLKPRDLEPSAGLEDSLRKLAEDLATPHRRVVVTEIEAVFVSRERRRGLRRVLAKAQAEGFDIDFWSRGDPARAIQRRPPGQDVSRLRRLSEGFEALRLRWRMSRFALVAGEQFSPSNRIILNPAPSRDEVSSDFIEIDGRDGVAAKDSLENASELRGLRVSHFSSRLSEKVHREALLEVLEDAGRHELRVELCSEVQPFGYLRRLFQAEGEAASEGEPLSPNELHRWARVLANYRLGSTVRAIHDWDLPRFWMTWSLLGPEERLCLIQVAEEGVCNPHNHHIVHRMSERGLVELHPLRMRRNLVKFVLHAETAHRVKQWERETEPNLWNLVRAPLFISLVLLTVALGAAPPDIAATTGALSMFSVGAPVVVRALASLRSGGGSGGTLA